MRNAAIFLPPLGNLAAAASPLEERARPLSDHHFPLPQSFVAASSVHAMHS